MKKRLDGYFRVSRTIDGHRVYFYAKSRLEAIRKAEKYTINRIIEQTLFSAIAHKWEDHHFSTLEYNTLKQYKPALRRAVIEFGERNITEITPGEIAAFINDFAKGGRADKTVRTQLMVLSLVFKYAINFCDVNMINPARDIIVPKHLPKKKLSSPSAEDIQRIKDNVDAPFGLFFYMAALTGMRKGELLCLEWTDISIKDRTISVNKSVYHDNNVPHVKQPKTKTSIRIIPIVDELLPHLHPGKGLVFPNEQGYIMSETQYQKQYKIYQQTTGITCTVHQLRHLYATLLFEKGLSPAESMGLLGHAQIQTTIDIYTDIREQKQKEINKKIYSLKMG